MRGKDACGADVKAGECRSIGRWITNWMKLGPPLPAEQHGEAMVIQGSSFRTKGETPDE